MNYPLDGWPKVILKPGTMRKYLTDRNGLTRRWPKARLSPDQKYVNKFKTVRWNAMNRRTVNGSSPDWKDPPKQKYFRKGLKLIMTRQQFNAFCDANRELILKIRDSGDKPSIDRINRNAGYSAKNVRIIPFRENCRLGSAAGKAAMIKAVARSVIAKTISGVFVGRYRSLGDAERALGVSRTKICAVCQKRYGRKSAGGYVFEYGKETKSRKPRPKSR